MPPTPRSRSSTAFRSVPLAASGQNEWQDAEVGARGTRSVARWPRWCSAAAPRCRTTSTFEIRDQDGRELPIRLPATGVAPERAPSAGSRHRAARQLLLGRLRRLALDRSGRRAPELPLGVRRRRERRRPGRGARATRAREPIARRLRVSDASGQVGGGAKRDFEVFVKRPPIAVAGDDLVVAPGEIVDFRRLALARRGAADRPLSLELLRRRPGRGTGREPQPSSGPAATS